MKTSIELITDLNTAEKKWGDALLIVGFPRMTRVVSSSFPERLQILEDLLQQGGIPVGMLSLRTIAGVEHFFFCVLEERVADEWAEPYMEAFCNKMATAEVGEAFADSIGIDDFRIQQ
jgi:hypothetical protein